MAYPSLYLTDPSLYLTVPRLSFGLVRLGPIGTDAEVDRER